MKDLFIVTDLDKKQAKHAWNYGMRFKADSSLPITVSKQNVDNLQPEYKRIILQYSTGTMEV